MKTFDMDKIPAFKMGYFTTMNEEAQSNWPYKNAANHRTKKNSTRPDPVWFIDENETGCTVTPAIESLSEARANLEAFGKDTHTIRLYHPTLKEIDEENASIRHEKRIENTW